MLLPSKVLDLEFYSPSSAIPEIFQRLAWRDCSSVSKSTLIGKWYYETKQVVFCTSTFSSAESFETSDKVLFPKIGFIILFSEFGLLNEAKDAPDWLPWAKRITSYFCKDWWNSCHFTCWLVEWWKSRILRRVDRGYWKKLKEDRFHEFRKIGERNLSLTFSWSRFESWLNLLWLIIQIFGHPGGE